MLKKDTRRGETSASLIINHRQSSFVTANALSSTLGWTSLGRPAEVKDDAGGSDLFTSFETSGSDARNVEHGRCATVLEIAVEMTSCDEMSMRRVLLVEDDDVLRRNYETLLCAHRLSVCACATQSEAIAAFGHHTFDVVILDVTLGPDYEAGFVLCQTFREKNKTTPIIFLTEHSDDHDRISGLRLGADDYLTKTISGTFLVARINALIRRVEALTGAAPEPAAPSRQAGSPLRIDERLSRAFWHNSPLELSLTQFWILKDLFEHVGEVRSTTELMRAAHITVQPNTIVVHIKAIRDLIQKITPEFSSIKSERARGYRWVDDR
jgi:two-component system, OmpR family, response regulator